MCACVSVCLRETAAVAGVPAALVAWFAAADALRVMFRQRLSAAYTLSSSLPSFFFRDSRRHQCDTCVQFTTLCRMVYLLSCVHCTDRQLTQREASNPGLPNSTWCGNKKRLAVCFSAALFGTWSQQHKSAWTTFLCCDNVKCVTQKCARGGNEKMSTGFIGSSRDRFPRFFNQPAMPLSDYTMQQPPDLRAILFLSAATYSPLCSARAVFGHTLGLSI